jgi:peptide/nickel transport system ATP-binding protein
VSSPGANGAGTYIRLLETLGLRVEYKSTGSLFSSHPGTVALDGVDFHLDRQTSTGLAGASGSGKSTLGRCLAGLETPTSGDVFYCGASLLRSSRAERSAHRRRVQLVFQDAASSLNPRFNAAQAISEPLRIAGFGNAVARRRRAMQLLEEVGLPASAADRPALEFSGGQRRRITIARALAAAPEVIIFDEAFSGLDEAVQTNILEMLQRLQGAHGLTYLFVSHDLGLLARACTEAAILHRGRIVERAPLRRLLAAPRHPYSQELVGAIPPVQFA